MPTQASQDLRWGTTLWKQFAKTNISTDMKILKTNLKHLMPPISRVFPLCSGCPQFEPHLVKLICGSCAPFLNVPFCLTYSSCKKTLTWEDQAPRAFWRDAIKQRRVLHVPWMMQSAPSSKCQVSLMYIYSEIALLCSWLEDLFPNKLYGMAIYSCNLNRKVAFLGCKSCWINGDLLLSKWVQAFHVLEQIKICNTFKTVIRSLSDKPLIWLGNLFRCLYAFDNFVSEQQKANGRCFSAQCEF